jgi:hypothetical protein
MHADEGQLEHVSTGSEWQQYDLVQGTTDEHGKFDPTVISGGLSGLFDQNGNYYGGPFDHPECTLRMRAE